MSKKNATIELPYLFKPRDYQTDLFKLMDGGIRRSLLIWPRRAGKDKTCFNFMVKEMFKKVGIYYYMFPTYGQGRKAFWETLQDGERLLDHIPGANDYLTTKKSNQYVRNINSQEMKIELTNGSLLRVIGANEVVTSIVGTNPIGVIYSEFALCDPEGWHYIAPILRENNGWAIFNSTPRGRNHLYHMLERNRSNPDWYVNKLTTEELGIYTQEEIKEDEENLRADGLTDDQIAQEMNCSFTAGVKGSYYVDCLNKAYGEGRIGHYPYNDQLPVDTVWDLGINDDTTIWFIQRDGDRVIFFDYLEESGKQLSYFAGKLLEREYRYNTHFLPHDGGNRRLQSGTTDMDVISQVSDDFGVTGEWVVVPRTGVQHGIQLVRSRFCKYYIDEGLCNLGIQHLHDYRRQWNNKTNSFVKHPCSNGSQHAADAFRMEATAHVAEFGLSNEPGARNKFYTEGFNVFDN